MNNVERGLSERNLGISLIYAYGVLSITNQIHHNKTLKNICLIQAFKFLEYLKRVFQC